MSIHLGFMMMYDVSGALDWDRLTEIPWVAALKGVPQNPVYHAEGDVWIHTRMVMEALLALEGYQALEQEEKTVLFWATLMHDIAKPACTVVEADGAITSRRHAVKGRLMSRSLLYREEPIGLPFDLREQVAHLVRYHGLPLWFLEKENSQFSVLKAAELVPMKLLALLAEADVRGRTCADKAELLERVALFQAYCEEQLVWDGPYPFADAAARAAYFRKPENGPQYAPFDDRRCEVILMAGLPGAGKNHWIQQNGGGLPVITLDDIRLELGITPKDPQGLVINTAKERAKAYLRRGDAFIWNATNIRPDIRKQLIDLFTSYKARTRIVYIEVPHPELIRQNRDREAVVPANVMARMVKKWEVPEIWEAERVDYVIR